MQAREAWQGRSTPDGMGVREHSWPSVPCNRCWLSCSSSCKMDLDPGMHVRSSELAAECKRTSRGSTGSLECRTRLTLAGPADLGQHAVLKQPGDALGVSCRRGRTRLGGLPVWVAHISRARRGAVRQQLPMDHYGQVAVRAVGGVAGHNLDLQQAGRLLRGRCRAERCCGSWG